MKPTHFLSIKILLCLASFTPSIFLLSCVTVVKAVASEPLRSATIPVQVSPILSEKIKILAEPLSSNDAAGVVKLAAWNQPFHQYHQYRRVSPQYVPAPTSMSTSIRAVDVFKEIQIQS